jgi:hypothetical protein
MSIESIKSGNPRPVEKPSNIFGPAERTGLLPVNLTNPPTKDFAKFFDDSGLRDKIPNRKKTAVPPANTDSDERIETEHPADSSISYQIQTTYIPGFR